MPSSRTISANGIEIFLLEKGERPLVVLCHGWPELSYSWRHQIRAIAAAGYHVVAPDMRGFGRTSAPANIAAYSIFDHVGDTVALVTALWLDRRQARRRHGTGSAQPQAKAHHRQRRALGPAGTRQRGQRGLDSVSGDCGREKRVQ
jgi:alpha-beta hydrolase superfamily lysophospholipase